MDIVDKLSSTEPALIITYGNTKRKIRPLDRDLLLLGQAPGCDLQLKSPDVFPVHLAIIRVGDSWRLRDCTGRSAARLNGKPFADEQLHDSDVIQLSTFSFHVHLPAFRRLRSQTSESGPGDTVLFQDGPSAPLGDAARAGPTGSVDKERFRHLECSRINLARLALKLRERFQTTQAALLQLQQQNNARDLAHGTRDREVDALIRDLKARVRQLEQQEADLRSRREAFAKEQSQERARVAADAEEQNLVPAVDADSFRALQIRAQELAHYVRYLRCRLTASAGMAPTSAEPVAGYHEAEQEQEPGQYQMTMDSDSETDVQQPQGPRKSDSFEFALRDRLAHIQKLREQLTGRCQALFHQGPANPRNAESFNCE